jgi:hypothetical protein
MHDVRKKIMANATAAPLPPPPPLETLEEDETLPEALDNRGRTFLI